MAANQFIVLLLTLCFNALNLLIFERSQSLQRQTSGQSVTRFMNANQFLKRTCCKMRILVAYSWRGEERES